jgi:hypothetical protein
MPLKGKKKNMRNRKSGHKCNGGRGAHGMVKVKVKFTLEQTMKAQRGSRGIDLLFL